MKSFILALIVFSSFSSQKCSSHDDDLKMIFIKSLIEDNKNSDGIYFKSKVIYFLGYHKNFNHEGYEVKFINRKSLITLLKKQKGISVISMSEFYEKEKNIVTEFKYLKVFKDKDNELIFKRIETGEMYCYTYNCNKKEYLVEWCGEPLNPYNR